MSNPEVHVTIFDTTARDGAQSLPEKNPFPVGSKPEIVERIAQLGVGVIEAGFPATPPQEGHTGPTEQEEVAETAKTIGQTPYTVTQWIGGEQIAVVNRPPVIAGLSRVTPGDIETTWEAIHAAQNPRIHTFVSTDDYHRQQKFEGVSREELIIMARNGVKHSKAISSAHTGATVEFSAEAASTTDMDYLERVIKTALDNGADVINVPDTVGQKDPLAMYRFYGQVIQWVMDVDPLVVISAHNHNDLGMAVANTVMLVQAATDYAVNAGKPVHIQAETTVCGIGERAGNADVFPFVAGLFKFAPEAPVPIRWQFNPGRSVETARTVMGIAGLEVERQNPIVGQDVIRHRSGIHSDGVIKGGHKMYTPFTPTFWGHPKNAIHEEGRYQGKAGRQAARAAQA